MGVPLQILTALSLLSLAHSIYSAYEATALLTPTITTTPQTPKIPTDITIQTVLSTIILLICIVFSAAPLRPIRWNEWAGRIEREGWEPAYDDGSRSVGGDKKQIGGAGNPFRILEDRKGFWDVRGARAEFATFVKEGGIGIGERS